MILNIDGVCHDISDKNIFSDKRIKKMTEDYHSLLHGYHLSMLDYFTDQEIDRMDNYDYPAFLEECKKRGINPDLTF